MAIGVSYDDFWYGPPALVGASIEAFEITERNRVVAADFNAWNAGRYVMLAVGTVLSQAFSKSSQAHYPSEPVVASELDEKLAEQKRERELRRMEAEFLARAHRPTSGADTQ